MASWYHPVMLIATIILLALFGLAAIGAVIVGVQLTARELRATNEMAFAQVRDFQTAISRAVESAIKTVGEQLQPRVVEGEELAAPEQGQEPPWAGWDEFDPFPDPTDAYITDPSTMDSSTRAVHIPTGFPLPGDRSAENLV